MMAYLVKNKHCIPQQAAREMVLVCYLSTSLCHIKTLSEENNPCPVSVQLLRALWKEEFKLRGKTYRFDDRGDINLGYDVSVWGSQVYDVVAEYHPLNDSFTYTKHNSTAQLRMLKVEPICNHGKMKRILKDDLFFFCLFIPGRRFQMLQQLLPRRV